MPRSIYVAGPMRGIDLFNFPAFDEAEATLTHAGWGVISPAAMDRQIGFDPATDDVTPDFMREAMKRDLDALQAVHAVAVLPGWERSKGATAEVAIAKWRGIPIFVYPSMRELDVLEDILDEAKRITSGDRQASYGPPDQDFSRTAAMWSALFGWQVETWQVAQAMICLKLSRLQHSATRDSYVDIAGYARCGQMCVDASKEPTW